MRKKIKIRAGKSTVDITLGASYEYIYKVMPQDETTIGVSMKYKDDYTKVENLKMTANY